MLFTVILSLVILAAILLVLVILAQNSKGGGLSSQFGGSGASNMIGVKKTGDLLENMTWGLIIAVFVLVLSSSFLIDSATKQTDEFIDRAKDTNVMTPSMDLGIDENADDNGTDGTAAPAGDGSGLEDLSTDSVE